MKQNGIRAFKKKSAYNVAVMGATGAVGQEMIQILAERNFPIASISFLASERSAGKTIGFKGKSYQVSVLSDRSFDSVDIVLASAGGAPSRQYPPPLVQKLLLFIN